MQAAAAHLNHTRPTAVWRLAPPAQYFQAPDRGALLHALDEAKQRPITVIAGSPGYGKTTLLVQWWGRMKAHGSRIAWYTASVEDREPEVFLKMLTASLEAAGVKVSKASQCVAQRCNAQLLLDALVLDLKQAPDRVEIVIDDFTTVAHPTIAQLVIALVNSVPDLVHVTLASRRQPPVYMGTLQASGCVHVIEPEELKLHSQELADALDLPQGCQQLEEAASVTEGWPVAVQLFRRWLRHASPDSNFRGFSSDTDMTEYVSEHVFGELPRPCQDLLLDLSPVEQATSDLADHMRDAADSIAILEQIASFMPGLVCRNLLNDVPTYRFHPLLRDYARARAARTPARTTELHLRAARWFWRERRYALAISHGVEAGDRGTLRGMLEGIPVIDLFLASGLSDLEAILRQAPDDCVQDIERLRLAAALVHFRAGYFTEALAALTRTKQDFAGKTAVDHKLLVDRLAVEMLIEGHFDDSLLAYEARVRRLQQAASHDALIWAMCDNLLTSTYQVKGDLEAAHAALARTKKIYAATGRAAFGEIYLHAHDLLLDLARGSLREAAARCTRVLNRKQSAQASEGPVGLTARIVAATVEYQRSFSLRCADTIEIAVEQLEEGERWYDQYAIAYPIILHATWRRHGLADVLDKIETMRKAAARRGIASLDGILNACEILYRARSGDCTGATRVANDSGLRLRVAASDLALPWREHDLGMQALITLDLMRDAHEEAANEADELCCLARRGGRLGSEIKALVLGALAAERLEVHERADTLLRNAMRHAYSENVIAPFAEEGGAIVSLIERAIDGAQPARLRHHAAAIVKVVRNARQFALTKREAEILAHINAGASNKTIAKRLGVSENTVKFHLKQVYAKLGVSSRKEAAAAYA